MPFVKINDIKYYYKISKRAPQDGVAAICLHGSGADGIVWSYQVSRLSKQFRIIVPDLPGHGKSGGEPLASVEEYTGWLERFRSEMNLASFFLMGHSFGGAIIQQYTRTHPERVHGLVLAGTGAGFKLSRMYRRMHEQGLDIEKELKASNIPDFFRTAYELVKLNGDGSLHADLMAAGRFDSTAWVSSIKQPAMVVWGSQDRITPRELPEELSRSLPNSELRVIDGAGHLVMVDARDEFNRVVMEFMTRYKE